MLYSMAGTATEQAIGLGKPVIQIEGKGPQFTKTFAEAKTFAWKICFLCQ